MTHASVFSGIGGPEVAATMLGWENLFHCEINPFGRKVLDYWFPDSESYEDITKTDFSKWQGRVNVLTGGFPCQPFSYAGKRGGAEDDRYLWPYMHKCINQIKPDWVVCENVAGITTMVEQGEVSEMESTGNLFATDNVLRRYRLQETFTLERICNDIEADGYEVQAVLIPACSVGAPHRRDRVFIIGRRIDADTADARTESLRQKRKNEIYRTEHASNTDSWRGCKVEESIGLQIPNGFFAKRNGSKRSSSNTNHTGLQETRSKQSAAMSWGAYLRNGEWYKIDKGSAEEAGCGRWANFPSVSPVHRGNDGISIPPYYDAIYERRNSMDRNSIIQGALSTGKIEVDFSTGNIYSTRIRGHEGERIKLEGAECNGYIVHTLSFNGVKKQCRAHQIVWIAKNGLYDKDRWQIDHKNRNRKDNRLENSHLVSASENIANQERPDTRILGDEERFAIWKLYNEGHNSIREIADDYGVSKSLVHKIVHEFPDLTISFAKWRTEALKAYGNAIVPQVMYEIFRAIEIVSKM